MAGPHRRRYVSRAAITLSGIVVLPAAYVASAVSLTFAFAAEWIPASAIQFVGPAYGPLGWYVEAEYPGHRAIEWACDEADELGRRLTDR